MNATGKRRLLKLADFLETGVPAERFDMDYWGDGNDRGTPRCGTVACALGWASAEPSLRRAGVKLSLPSTWTGSFQGGSSFDVANRVFGVNSGQFDAIFAPKDSNRLKGRRALSIVAKRIRKLVAAEQKRAT